jgi:hypothetical protein
VVVDRDRELHEHRSLILLMACTATFASASSTAR